MTKRSVAAVVLLTIFTCGIYSLYWFYVTTEELNNEKPEEEVTNYVVAILLSIITCGIYMIYWLYKFYSKVDSVTGKQNVLINLIINIFLTALVPMAIAQSSINDYVERGE